MPRSISPHKESITSIDLHVFGDDSIVPNCTAVYAVVNQPSGISQGLVASKSQISKTDLKIPRLKLVSAHMACNLISNVQSDLKNQNIRSALGWADSVVMINWLKRQGGTTNCSETGLTKFLKGINLIGSMFQLEIIQLI